MTLIEGPDDAFDAELDRLQHSLERNVNNDLRKQAAQCAMFHELVAALRCVYDDGHYSNGGVTHDVLTRAEALL